MLFIKNLLRKVHRIDVYNPQEVLYTIFKDVSMYHKEDLANINGFIVSDFHVFLDTINKDFMNEFSVSVRSIKIDYKDKGVVDTGKTMSIQIKGDKLPHNQFKERFEAKVGSQYFGMTQKKKLFKINELDRSDLYIMYVPKDFDTSMMKPTNPKESTNTIEEMYAYAQEQLNQRYKSKNKIRMSAYGLYLNKFRQSDLTYWLLTGNPQNVKPAPMRLNYVNAEIPCFIIYDNVNNAYLIYTVTHLFKFTKGEEPKVIDFYEEVLDDVKDILDKLIGLNARNGVLMSGESYGLNYRNIYTKSREVKPYSRDMH